MSMSFNFIICLLIYLTCINILANCALIKLNSDTTRNKRDSYLSAYKVTHDLNDHAIDGTPQGVVYVDANSDHHDLNVHPIYVHNHNHLDGPHPAVDHLHEENFHLVNAQHGNHAEVPEHHYEDYHDYPQEVPPTGIPSGLGNYGSSAGGVNNYGPQSSGAHLHDYGYGTYGPPISMNYHQTPSHGYGLSSPVYVPPTLAPVYIPSHGPGAVYGPPHRKLPPLSPTHNYYEPEPPFLIPDFLQDLVSPHAFLGILDKIKLFKIDLFTIVIPSLKSKGKESTGIISTMVNSFGATGNDDEDDDDRRRKGRMHGNKKSVDHINSITAHVLKSIESFERKFRFTNSVDSKNCDNTSRSDSDKEITKEESIYCTSQSIVDKINEMVLPYLHMDTHENTKHTNVTVNYNNDTNMNMNNRKKKQEHYSEK